VINDSQQPPTPFSRASPTLAPFLDALDQRHAYIVHVDRFPADFKRRIFAVPVILNIVISILLVWRLYAATPTYLAIFTSVIGYETPATIDTSRPMSELIWIVVKRTLMFMFDFLLLRFIGPWPITFFLEAPGNPVVWRWKVGFREEEIAVRVSRGWGTEELMEGVKTGDGSPFFQTRILPAIARDYMRKKTAYLMMGKDWDLDFSLMVWAHKLVDEKKLALEDFQKSVFAYSEQYGWLCWQVWKLDEQGAEEDVRKRIVELKDKLTAMGKENLFFRWIEIVQYESSSGDFTPERQQATLKKVEKVFDDQGVNFKELIESVGGMEGMPGTEKAG
jgi:hypothetical protein